LNKCNLLWQPCIQGGRSYLQKEEDALEK